MCPDETLTDDSEAHAETNEELIEQQFDPEHVTALSVHVPFPPAACNIC
jgi:hypothetical protein